MVTILVDSCKPRNFSVSRGLLYHYVCNIHKEILILNMSRVNVSILADVFDLTNPLNNIHVDRLP